MGQRHACKYDMIKGLDTRRRTQLRRGKRSLGEIRIVTDIGLAI